LADPTCSCACQAVDADSVALVRFVDRISDACAWVSAWLFTAAGVMLTYEVVARYFFTRPTVWAAELSQLCLIWGSLLAMAWAMRARKHIAIVAVTSRLPAAPRRWLDALSLSFVALFSLPVLWKGGEVALDSFWRGRSTGTMLDIPNWWSESAVPFGFTLLAIQSVLEVRRVLRSQEQADDGEWAE